MIDARSCEIKFVEILDDAILPLRGLCLLWQEESVQAILDFVMDGLFQLFSIL